MLQKNEELLKKNPYAFDNYEYNMDEDVYIGENGVYSPAELERLNKQYEDRQKKQEQYDDLDATIYEERSDEEMAKLYADDNQLKLKESVEEDITAANVKKEKLLSAGGDPVPEPKYIGWDQAFSVRQKDDSEKMAGIRSALAHYHEVKGSDYEGDALRNLITSCNTYTWMKVPFLKFGKAKERLDEVKALRTRAMQELEQSPYKNITLKADSKEEKEKSKSTGDETLIYNVAQGNYEQHLLDTATTGQKVAAGLGLIFGTLILTPLKIATYPLKLMAYGVDKLYRHVEKKFDVRDTRRELNISPKAWLPNQYFGATLRAMRDPIFTTSDDEKESLLREKDDESLYEISSEAQKLEEAENDALDLLEYKQKLKAELEKKDPDPETVENLRNEVETLQDNVDTYLKENPEETLPLEDHAPLDEFLAKAKPLLDKARMKANMMYDGRLQAEEMAKEYKERDAETQQEIREKTQTEDGKEAFKNEMHQLAMANVHIRVNNADMDLSKRDEAYDEQKLLQIIDEFEAFDIKEVNFTNHVDMLRDYEKNMNYFERSRAAHYQLMRGLNRGFKLDDERLIKLRAKFMAMFEMQNYLSRLNHMVLKGEVDLSGDPEVIRETVINGQSKKLIDRYPATIGDNDAFLAEVEKGIRDQYNNREKTIKRMHKYLARDGKDEKIPADLLKQKMDAYESNEILYDYIQRKGIMFNQEYVSDRMAVFNEENGTKVANAVSRTHGNFLWGKTDEEVIGLTNMATQKGYPKLEYIKELITEIKSIDLKEFDHKDPAKFYDNFDRKAKVLLLWSNATDLKGLMESALKEIREEENKERAERGEEPNNAPLELPDMFKEMGYTDLEEFNIDATVTQDVGNMIAGHFDAIVQTTSHGNLSYFSPQELGMLDAKKSEDIKKSLNAFAKRMARKGIDVEIDDELIEDPVFRTAFYMFKTTDLYNPPINTRRLSEKQKAENKKNEKAGNKDAIIRQQRMTLNVKVEEIYREEKQSHYLKRIKESREPQTKEQLLAEKERAEKLLKKQDEIYDGRTKLLIKNGYDKNSEYRTLRAYTGALSSLCGDTEEKSLERVKALSVKPSEATPEQKQAMAKELESVFKMLMDFDLKELNFKSYSDVLNEAHEHASMMVRFCFDGAYLFDYYEALIKDESTKTLLDEEEYREIMTKKDFLLRTQKVYDLLSRQVTKPMHQFVDCISLLSLSDKEFEDYAEEFQEKEHLDQFVEEHPEIMAPDVAVFFSNMDSIRRALHENMIYPGMNMEEVYRATSTRLNGSGSAELTGIIREKLNQAA